MSELDKARAQVFTSALELGRQWACDLFEPDELSEESARRLKTLARAVRRFDIACKAFDSGPSGSVTQETATVAESEGAANLSPAGVASPPPEALPRCAAPAGTGYELGPGGKSPLLERAVGEPAGAGATPSTLPPPGESDYPTARRERCCYCGGVAPIDELRKLDQDYWAHPKCLGWKGIPSEPPAAPEPIRASERRAIWQCKVGSNVVRMLPDGCDPPMRAAVRDAYERITGADPEFIFSGWNTELTEPELAAVENRMPAAPEPSGDERVLAECDHCHQKKLCSTTPGTGGGGIECDPPCAETLNAARDARKQVSLKLLAAEAKLAAVEGTQALLLRRLRERNRLIAQLSKGVLYYQGDEQPLQALYAMGKALWLDDRNQAQYYRLQFEAVCRSHTAANKGISRRDEELVKLGSRVHVLRAVARIWQARLEEVQHYCDKAVSNRAALIRVEQVCDSIDEGYGSRTEAHCVAMCEVADRVRKAMR